MTRRQKSVCVGWVGGGVAEEPVSQGAESIPGCVFNFGFHLQTVMWRLISGLQTSFFVQKASYFSTEEACTVVSDELLSNFSWTRFGHDSQELIVDVFFFFTQVN